MALNRGNLRAIALMSHELEQDVRDLASKDRTRLGFAERVEQLNDVIQDWAQREMKNLKQDTGDDIGRGPGYIEPSDEMRQRMSEEWRQVSNDSGPFNNDAAFWARKRQEADRFMQESQIGEDIARRFNPHYQNH